jgi:hypothetical protein
VSRYQTGQCLKDILDLVQVAVVERGERILTCREGAALGHGAMPAKQEGGTVIITPLWSKLV